MEVAPQELAQLLKLAGVGADPEPDMPEPEMDSEPEVSVMAIPSDDGAPIGGGCGAPDAEHDHPHDHPHDHDDMRSIIDMLQSSGDEPIEESPPKDDYENASKEFTGHPVDVVGTYDQYSYEPAKNSGMQRRTNSYGDNPLREEDLIKEYTEFKKKSLDEAPDWWNRMWGKPTDAELKAAETGPIDREPGAQKGQRSFLDRDSAEYKKNMAARPGSLTKPVPKQANTASSGIHDVEGPETALPGAQTRSNRQVAARNAKTKSVASGGMKTNNQQRTGPETFQNKITPQRKPTVTGPETFQNKITPQQTGPETFQNVITPQNVGQTGPETFQNVIKPQCYNSTKCRSNRTGNISECYKTTTNRSRNISECYNSTKRRPNRSRNISECYKTTTNRSGNISECYKITAAED